MNEMTNFIFFLFATAVTQNMVLSTGFGSSMLLRVIRQPKAIFPFAALLGTFCVLTVGICYPLDMLIGTEPWAKLLRPLMIVAVVAVLYLFAAAILPKCAPKFWAHYNRLLPLSAFNNLVIGIALISNHSFALSVFGAIALALGCCFGFTVLALVTAEGLERLDNPDIPPAFRGLPATLIYVGLLALAILGFAPSVSLI